MNETPTKIQYVLTDDLQQEVITRMLVLIKESYIFPEVAEKVENIILSKLNNGDYIEIIDPTQFCQIITKDLQSISKDKHLGLKFLEMPKAQTESDKEKEAEKRNRLLALHNYGFDKVERLPGNIGYHKTVKFFETEIEGDVAVASLNFLTNTSAIIFDLRENTGGDAGMVALICSYLFKGRVHLNDFHWRKGNRIEQIWTNSHIEGKTLHDKDVFVLTSERTFSGAEDFAYNLKALKRATIVGERTSGGAHPGGFQRINDHFTVNIPIGRAVNPITNDNWEGIGVAPHIEVSEEHALYVSQYLILKKLIKKSPDAEIMGQRWKKTADELEHMLVNRGIQVNAILKQIDIE
ncbi:S41 family peptidase [Sporosarcina thermotolerans]|uniref:S41 family peptidase n=1 Tax=Sporosarcina thermotolerans TaxID=633404 RepID=A0AAW9A6N4_9BACL|nr:S41 family peptidase [Sporosarcina thermotolerans]MDW0115950.1 S41 family peptidase [Sporosarcina thermotolerans]WHT46839.1 S41 family peptidase [Sporosarcina thermotolerans]